MTWPGPGFHGFSPHHFIAPPGPPPGTSSQLPPPQASGHRRKSSPWPPKPWRPSSTGARNGGKLFRVAGRARSCQRSLQKGLKTLALKLSEVGAVEEAESHCMQEAGNIDMSCRARKAQTQPVSGTGMCIATSNKCITSSK